MKKSFLSLILLFTLDQLINSDIQAAARIIASESSAQSFKEPFFKSYDISDYNIETSIIINDEGCLVYGNEDEIIKANIKNGEVLKKVAVPCAETEKYIIGGKGQLIGLDIDSKNIFVVDPIKFYNLELDEKFPTDEFESDLPIAAESFSQSGKYLVGKIKKYNTVTVYNLSNREKQSIQIDCIVNNALISPDDKYLAILGADFAVNIFDLETGKFLHKLTNDINSICFVNKDIIALGARNKDEIILHNLKDNKEFVLKLNDRKYQRVDKIVVSENGEYLVAIFSKIMLDRAVSIWNLNTNKLVQIITSPLVDNIAISTKGKYLAIGSLYSNTIEIYKNLYDINEDKKQAINNLPNNVPNKSTACVIL